MEPKRLWNRRFVQLLLIEALLQMGGFLTRSIIANYAVDLGASVPVAGFLAGMLATAALAIRPVSGAISDKLSKKTLLTVSCGLFAAGAFGCALVRSVPLMGACLALQGFAFAFKSAIVISLVPLVVPARYTGTGVGWMGLAYTVAIALGPAIGLEVGVVLGYPATFALSGAILLGALVLAALFKAPPETAGAAARADAAKAAGAGDADAAGAAETAGADAAGAGVEAGALPAAAGAGAVGAGLAGAAGAVGADAAVGAAVEVDSGLAAAAAGAVGAGSAGAAGAAGVDSAGAAVAARVDTARVASAPAVAGSVAGREEAALEGRLASDRGSGASADARLASATAGARRRGPSLRALFYLPVIPLAVVGGTLMVSQGVTSSFILLAGEMRGIEAVSLYFVFYSIANLGARPLAGRASDAWGVRRVAPPMMLVAALGMLALAFVPSVAGVALGGVCMGLGQGSAYAAIQAESVRGVPADQLGRSANTYFIGPDLGMGLGPVAGGAVLQAWGPAAMFVFNALTILLALALFLALGPLKRRVKSPLFGNE